MVQVRLSDQQYNEFETLRKQMGINNNAATLRQLIDDRKNLGQVGQNAVAQVQQTYNDLSAKLEGLMWDSSNVTKNMNEIAHTANIAKNSDPTNSETWAWIIKALQTEYQQLLKLNGLVDDTKKFLRESRDYYANSTE
jgi:septum formation inhibitor-activating ATPase MinD